MTDTDDLEVIRNKTNMSTTSSSSTKNVTRTSRVSSSRHRSTNREVLIDDYYSTVEQLQKSNRDLSKTRDREQRCRTDMLVTQQATPNEPSPSFSKTPSLRSLSPASTAGGGSKQVTTYTYYTITKDGQKKTVYGGKQQKVVGNESENN